MTSHGPPPVPGGRSESDRERERMEREARRRGTAWDEPMPDFDFGGGRGQDQRARPRRAARPPRSAAGSAAVRRRRIAALALIAVIAVAIWFLFSLFQPFKGDGSGRVTVTIPRGATLSGIADRLESRGVITSAFFFKLRARLDGNSGDFKPGSYSLKQDMSYSAVMASLSAGVAPDLVRITIPEGKSRKEVAPLVRQAGIRGSYLAASKSSPALNPRRYGAKAGTSLEGFLFPATYEVKKGSSAKDLVAKQLAAFKDQIAHVSMSYAKKKNLTTYDVVIIASMVEREAMLDRERPLIASVIYNRLKQGMPLGIDATIRYYLNDWDHPLKESQLALPTGYNTRSHQGLPPGPIGNPGLKSLEAAAHPASTGYLFYVVKPDTCGEHAFSSTDAQFQRDVNRYNSARNAKGGKSPTTCK